MKIILSSKRHHYVAIVSIFLIMLIMVALIAGMVGCGQPAEYTPMVAAGGYHTVGLKSSGTVVAVGPPYWFWAFLEVDDSLLDVDGWDLK